MGQDRWALTVSLMPPVLGKDFCKSVFSICKNARYEKGREKWKLLIMEKLQELI